MISWITDNIVIGEYTDAVNEELLKREKIDCVLCLRLVCDSKEVNTCNYLEIPLFHIPVGKYEIIDNVQCMGVNITKIELRTATYMLEQLAKKYKRILVHCTAGMDRAPFVVALYLAKWKCDTEWTYGLPGDFKYWFTEAYKDIKKKRPQIIEHLEWL